MYNLNKYMANTLTTYVKNDANTPRTLPGFGTTSEMF